MLYELRSEVSELRKKQFYQRNDGTHLSNSEDRVTAALKKQSSDNKLPENHSANKEDRNKKERSVSRDTCKEYKREERFKPLRQAPAKQVEEDQKTHP